MDAVVRMLRAVKNEFAALLTARVPQSCIADLKQKLGLFIPYVYHHLNIYLVYT